MKKTWIIIITVVLLIVLMTGCGIPQEEHDTVITERDSLQEQLKLVNSELDTKESELQSVQTELASVQNELETNELELQSVQNELDAKKSELQSVKSQLSSSKSTVRSLQTKTDKALAYGIALNIAMYPTRTHYNIPTKLQYNNQEEWCVVIKAFTNATEDKILNDWALEICAETPEAIAQFWSHGIIMLVRTLQE